MRRRTLISALGGTVASWSLTTRAQSMPTLGYLSAGSHKGNYARALAMFLRGLAEAGYENGRNVTIEYRWAAGQIDRLQALAAVVPPVVDLRLVRIDGRLPLVDLSVHRQALRFPSADGALVTFQVGSNFFPRIQSFTGRLGGANLLLGFVSGHVNALRGNKCGFDCSPTG